jgi:hypothetical protein
MIRRFCSVVQLRDPDTIFGIGDEQARSVHCDDQVIDPMASDLGTHDQLVREPLPGDDFTTDRPSEDELAVAGHAARADLERRRNRLIRNDLTVIQVDDEHVPRRATGDHWRPRSHLANSRLAFAPTGTARLHSTHWVSVNTPASAAAARSAQVAIASGGRPGPT